MEPKDAMNILIDNMKLSAHVPFSASLLAITPKQRYKLRRHAERFLTRYGKMFDGEIGKIDGFSYFMGVDQASGPDHSCYARYVNGKFEPYDMGVAEHLEEPQAIANGIWNKVKDYSSRLR